MMDEATIRRQLAEFKNRLAHMDEERDGLRKIVEGYETLLRAMSATETGPEPSPARSKRHGAKNAPVGAVSMRSAITRVLYEASGAPLHSKEILARAEALGATTNAKAPLSVVDLVLLGLASRGRVEKVAPRTWKWSGEAPRISGK
jgi:hypothetical protein